MRNDGDDKDADHLEYCDAKEFVVVARDADFRKGFFELLEVVEHFRVGFPCEEDDGDDGCDRDDVEDGLDDLKARCDVYVIGESVISEADGEDASGVVEYVVFAGSCECCVGWRRTHSPRRYH